jgi:uncharacterized protein
MDMQGRLSPDEIERVLMTEMLGRIGCHAEGRTYVVPISYVYEGGSIYGYSAEGMKLRMMRENPAVCFEVEQVESFSRWRSVIAWGTFEEVVGQDAARAMQILLDGFASRITEGEASPHIGPHRRGLTVLDARLYLIRLTEKTGRYEQR